MAMDRKVLRGFVSRNIVSLVMVPCLIGGHYLWYRLQQVDSLVSVEDRKKLPFSTLFDKD